MATSSPSRINLFFITLVVEIPKSSVAMIRTITIDIINEKALQLLKDLELLQLIRVRNETAHGKSTNGAAQYKGAMTKQSKVEIDSQLNGLRNSWE